MISYTLIYRDHGERKKKCWEYTGPKNKLKEWECERTKDVKDITLPDGMDYLVGVWKGLKK